MTNNNTEITLPSHIGGVETASHAGHCLVIETELYTKYMGVDKSGENRSHIWQLA